MNFSECRQLQQEEWEVLEAIYPDCVSSGIADDGSLKLEIPVELGQPRDVTLIHNGPPQHLSLSMLPPFLLDIVLPQTYPSKDPPQISSLRATHLWLPSVATLAQQLLDMFQPGEGVLYAWVDYLRTGQFLDLLGLDCGPASSTITIAHPAPHIISPLLAAYDSASATSRFAQNSYACSICLTHHKGSKCIQLPCAHIFCRACLRDFWQMCVSEGEIMRVGCPDPACVKLAQPASEEQVARVLTTEEIQRWRWLKEKYALEKDPSIVHCPMKYCQRPVPKQFTAATEAESGWERLRTCPACSYSFCSFCKRTWHGPISHCAAATDDLAKEYLSYEENSSERERMYRQFGRKTILKLVATYQEDQLNKEFLAANTTPCPGCEVNVEKTSGCNHMTCAKCSQHFCYRCGQKLYGNPYEHFSRQNTPCYMKLFDTDSIDDGEWIHDFDGL